MTDHAALPPSMAVTPNIPFHKQTVAQLHAELSYWQAQAESKKGWGSAYAAALENARDIQAELNRRQKP